MKNLFVFCCFFFIVGSVSAQSCYEWKWSNDAGWELKPVPCHVEDDDGRGDPPGSGDPPGTGATGVCRTNTTMVSQTTHSPGNGCFITEIEWAYSCSNLSGNTGSCTIGVYYEYNITGCEDVELPPESGHNLTTVNCN